MPSWQLHEAKNRLSEVVREAREHGPQTITAVLSPLLKRELQGIEHADSITCDAHKWLSVPVGAGMFFCRHPEAVLKCFQVEAQYVPTQSDPERSYLFKSTMLWSRRFMGLKVFMLLAELGLEGLARRLEHQAAMGELLRTRLLEQGWQVVNSTRLPVVLFTHPALEDPGELVEALLREEVAWISLTRVRGQRVLRCCITNFRTQPEDLDVLLEGLGRHLRCLR